MGPRSRRTLALTCCIAIALAGVTVSPAAAQLLPSNSPVETDLNRIPGVGGVADAVENATGVDLPGLGSSPAPSQPLPEPSNDGAPAPAPSAPPSAGAPSQTDETQGGSAPSASPATQGSGSAAAPTPSASDASARPAADDGATRRANDDATGRDRTDASTGDRADEEPAESTPVTRFIGDIGGLPWTVFALIAALALLGIVMAGRSAVLARVSRRLHLQRRELREDVGALQSALLPQVPERIGDVEISVAYRPKDGPAAGGDFHDVIALGGDRIALMVGDVSGHGREALTITALAHYTVRAYLEAGLEPREAMRLADEALGGKLGDDFVTVVAALYDPATSTLTYSTAGHPAPIITDPGGRADADGSVHILTPPPIGVGPQTGFRQTAISVPAGAAICLFSDGLVEARIGDGTMLDREGVAQLLGELGDTPAAERLLDRITDEAMIADDTTVCVLRPRAAAGDGSVIEELDLHGAPAVCDRLDAFAESFGMPANERHEVVAECRRAAAASESSRLLVRRDPGGAVTWKIGIGGGRGLRAGRPTAGVAS